MSLWDNFLRDITKEFKDKENFLKGNTIRRCLHPTMNSMTALKYFNEVNHLDFLKQDPQTGNPTYCIDKFSLVTLQSSLYLKTMLKKSKLDTIDEIHDIGGGYGNMAWTLKNYGYDKKYIIYDFPIISLATDGKVIAISKAVNTTNANWGTFISSYLNSRLFMTYFKNIIIQ